MISSSRPDLAALAELAAEFARAHPTLATRLAEPSTDPDVEALLAAFGDLTERIHRGLDADAPRGAHFFSELVLPELSRPLPSATILELESDSAARVFVPPGCEFESVPVDGTRCRFRAGGPITVVPWRIARAEITWDPERGQELVVAVQSSHTRGCELHTLLPLRLHLAGDPRGARALLLHLCRHVGRVEIRDPARPAWHAEITGPLLPCGEHEPLLPVEPDEHPGYRLVREFYMLPAKQLFVELGAMDPRLGGERATHLELRFRLDAPWPQGLTVSRDNVRLNCVPVANVFETTADPVRPSLERPRQALRPAGLPPGHGEVYAVRRVLARTLDHPGMRRLAAASEHAATGLEPVVPGAFFVAEPAAAATGHDTLLTVGTVEGTASPPIEFLSVELWATNTRLTAALGAGEVRAVARGFDPVLRVRNLTAPTPHRAPAHGRELRWRTLAAGALSAAPLARVDSLRTLLHVLNLHPLADAQAARAHERRLLAIESVSCRAAPSLVDNGAGAASVGGFDVTIDLLDSGFDDEGEAFAFASLLASLFAHQAPLNAFVRTTVHMLGNGRRFVFPARHGDRVFETPP